MSGTADELVVFGGPANLVSREVPQLSRLKQMQAVYPLAFGQPRQEDLLSYLSHYGASTTSESTSSSYRISLAPSD
jgi:hypothetical protein